jgi:hypothetical protein
MLPSDSRGAAEEMAQQTRGLPVQHWWEPEQRLAELVGASVPIAPAEVAWDIYLVYDAGAEFSGAAPAPADWVHQLAGVAPDRYCGGGIDEALAELAGRWRRGLR